MGPHCLPDPVCASTPLRPRHCCRCQFFSHICILFHPELHRQPQCSMAPLPVRAHTCIHAQAHTTSGSPEDARSSLTHSSFCDFVLVFATYLQNWPFLSLQPIRHHCILASRFACSMYFISLQSFIICPSMLVLFGNNVFRVSIFFCRLSSSPL